MTDDVLVSDPPHRSTCRYCCPQHDALSTQIASAQYDNQSYRRQMYAVIAERDELRAEVEKLRQRTEAMNDAQSKVVTLEWKLSEATKAAEQFQTALAQIEAGFHMRMSAAELASIARRAL